MRVEKPGQSLDGMNKTGTIWEVCVSGSELEILFVGELRLLLA